MRISGRLLLIGLCAIGLYWSPRVLSSAQQGQSVNVRPRTAANQPGMPEVRVTVDRNRVPLGEEVTFTLSPAHVVTDPRYKVTLFFGDQSSRVMSQPKIVHLYRRAATFTYSILVEPASPQPKPTPIPTPKPTPTPRPTPTLAIPTAKLSVTPATVKINRPVSLSAQLSRPYPNIRYRFVFGDGTAGGWQTEARATHAYPLPGAYQAYVDLGVSANGSIKQASSSKRESIQVSGPSPPTGVAVKLSASATSVKVAAPITFTARVNSRQSNVRYRFFFGDQTGSGGWQANSQVRHRYNSVGKFSARAEVRVNNRTGAQSASSNPISVDVRNDSAKPTVDLTVVSDSMSFGVPAFFRAVPSTADSKTRYRFNFGDGSSLSEWSSEPELTHVYGSPGSYSAFVEIGAVGDQGIKALAVSAQKQLTIKPTVPPDKTNGNVNTIPSNVNSNPPDNSNPNVDGNANLNLSGNTNGNANSKSSPTASGTPTPIPNSGPTGPSDWWKYLIIIAIILIIGYQVGSYVFAPRPTFVPHFDPGDANAGVGLAIDLQIEVDPNVAGGEFRLDTQGESLIKSERTE